MSIYSIQMNGNYHTSRPDASKVLLSSFAVLAFCTVIITLL